MHRALAGFATAVPALTATILALKVPPPPIGFVPVNALGQNGTTGGAGGPTVANVPAAVRAGVGVGHS